MKTQRSRLARIAVVTTVAALIPLAAVFFSIEQPRQVTEMEAIVAKMPLGITADEADRRMGGAPNSIYSTHGVLISPVTMLAAENDRAKEYGDSQEYSMRVWERDGIRAIVALASDGSVAGRWTWRPDDDVVR